MPKPYELPRRKVESKISNKEFEAKKEQLELGNIFNSKFPPKAEPKPNPMGHQPVPPDPLSKALRTVVQNLSAARPSNFLVNPADFLKEAPPWRRKAELYCADLAGYWNDVRHEIGV